ncbi:MAG: hypothetical protein KJ915_01905 [Candidatus Omnitrophica bacterium]|nr:hypothetical protein [Candidatus Omnitrophota bacterium]
MLKISHKLIVFIVLISFLSPNALSFGYLNTDINTLSPRLNLDRTAFQTYLVGTSMDLLQSAEQFVVNSLSPEDTIGKVIYRIKINGETLIVRKRIVVFSESIEVYHDLMRLDDYGQEEHLGYCEYEIKGNQAIIENKYESGPAFWVLDRGNGQGAVLFAAVLESARHLGIKRFLIIHPSSTLYEKFGFKEIPGDYELSEKYLNPDDPSVFTIARSLIAQRWKIANPESMPFYVIEKNLKNKLVKLAVNKLNILPDQSI